MRGACARRPRARSSAASGTRSGSTASTSAPRRASSSSRCADTLILSTTNGTRTILAAAERCDEVVLGSLLNLSAVAEHARAHGVDVAIFCAGFKGAFALDDAYCAGRIVALLGAERSDAAIAAELVARSFADPHEALNARTYGPRRARGGHPVLLPGERPPDRAAVLADGRRRSRDRSCSSRTGSRSVGRPRSRPGGWSRRASRSRPARACARSSAAATRPTRRSRPRPSSASPSRCRPGSAATASRWSGATAGSRGSTPRGRRRRARTR